MVYVVFSCYRLGDFTLKIKSNDKQKAITNFKDATNRIFKIDYKVDEVYFVCFDTETELGAYINSLNTFSNDDFKRILNNLGEAVHASCMHTFTPFCAKTRLKFSNTCEECGKETDLDKNAYNKYLCQDCWDEYIHTGTGFVEYAIGLSSGIYKIGAFNDTDKSAIIAAWQANRGNLEKLTDEDKSKIETDCENLGLVIAPQAPQE